MERQHQTPYESLTLSPTLTLETGHVVSRNSVDPERFRSPWGLIEYTLQFESILYQPFPQTADLAVIVRDELDKKPDIAEGRPDLDGSNYFQRVSDVALFRMNYNGQPYMAVSDLPSMYPGNLAEQLKTAQRIEWGIEIRPDDPLVDLIEDTSGERKSDLPNDPRPLIFPLADCLDKKSVRAIFPKEAERNVDYLTRKGYRTLRMYLLDDQILNSIKNRKKAFILPLGLGGAVPSHPLNDFSCVGNFKYNGMVRAGSGWCPKHLP